MQSGFKGKVGQLVSWETIDLVDDTKKTSHIGIIIEVNDNGSVVVQFVKQDWTITLQTKNLKLLNDVETRE